MPGVERALEKRDSLAGVLPEPRVDRGGVPPAQRDIGTAAGQVAQHTEVLGDLDGVVRVISVVDDAGTTACSSRSLSGGRATSAGRPVHRGAGS